MVVTVSARHMDITPPLKAYAEEKAGKLTNEEFDLMKKHPVTRFQFLKNTCTINTKPIFRFPII